VSRRGDVERASGRGGERFDDLRERVGLGQAVAHEEHANRRVGDARLDTRRRLRRCAGGPRADDRRDESGLDEARKKSVRAKAGA
jgi:hypothetical protein